MELTPVTVYINGSCKGNPGPGGWAAVVIHEDKERNLEGCKTYTTSNEMLLKALVEAAKFCKTPCRLTVVTDASYPVMDNERYKKLSAKEDWPNKSLWKELVTVCMKNKHKLRYENVENPSAKHTCREHAQRQAELAQKKLRTEILPGKSCRELIEQLKLDERWEKLEKQLEFDKTLREADERMKQRGVCD